MAATVTVRGPATKRQNHPKIAKPTTAALEHAVRIIHAICGLAGSPTLIDDIQADLTADKVRGAIKHRDTAAVFDWLLAALSYQGIADAVAYDYMEKHGRAAWHGQCLDVCNGNRINDNRRCDNMDCRVRLMCDRVALRKGAKIETIVVR
jgi:hypothetical protein